MAGVWTVENKKIIKVNEKWSATTVLSWHFRSQLAHIFLYISQSIIQSKTFHEEHLWSGYRCNISPILNYSLLVRDQWLKQWMFNTMSSSMNMIVVHTRCQLAHVFFISELLHLWPNQISSHILWVPWQFFLPERNLI